VDERDRGLYQKLMAGVFDEDDQKQHH